MRIIAHMRAKVNMRKCRKTRANSKILSKMPSNKHILKSQRIYIELQNKFVRRRAMNNDIFSLLMLILMLENGGGTECINLMIIMFLLMNNNNGCGCNNNNNGCGCGFN